MLQMRLLATIAEHRSRHDLLHGFVVLPRRFRDDAHFDVFLDAIVEALEVLDASVDFVRRPIVAVLAHLIGQLEDDGMLFVGGD